MRRIHRILDRTGGSVGGCPAHINLTVGIIDASVRFYSKWLGFGDVDRRFPDGTTLVRDAESTDLAFHTDVVASGANESFHFGFRRSTPGEVLALDEIENVRFDNEADVVSVKFPDPDGYVVEVY